MKKLLFSAALLLALSVSFTSCRDVKEKTDAAGDAVESAADAAGEAVDNAVEATDAAAKDKLKEATGGN